MRKTIIMILMILNTAVAGATCDTLRISTSYTTHVIFPTDLVYADLSNTSDIAAKIVDQNRNMLAIRARGIFSSMASVSALESNGQMHTFIVCYDESPGRLILDLRSDSQRTLSGMSASSGSHVSSTGKADAPLLSEVVTSRQRLYHLGSHQYGIEVQCTNIVSYSDRTFIVMTLRNRSGVSYEIADATFVIESRKGGRRKVEFEQTIFPQSKTGSLSTAPGETSRSAWSFDKMTLSKDQVLKVYFYEESGQRNLEMTIDTGDVNHSRRTL